jgi:hypothetical protein
VVEGEGIFNSLCYETLGKCRHYCLSGYGHKAVNFVVIGSCVNGAARVMLVKFIDLIRFFCYIRNFHVSKLRRN